MGEIGMALHHVLARQADLEITGWDKNASKLPEQSTLQASVSEAEIIFVCVPSWNLSAALRSIAPYIKDSAGIVSLAKGIEKESHKSVDEILNTQLPGHASGVLGGPMIAEDMLGGKLTAGVFAASNGRLKTKVKKIFKNSAVRIVTSSDVHGTAICGVLKNVYTLSIGIAEGVGLGENAKGALFAIALGEMRTIMKLLGGKTTTVLGLAGAGDFFATALSTHSRNRNVGIALGTGGEGYLESEGFTSFSSLQTLISVDSKRLPLLSALIKIANKQAPPSLLEQAVFDQLRA